MLPERHRGVPVIAVSCVLFAAMAVCARLLAGRMDAGEQVFIRFVVGLLGIIPVYVWRRRLPQIRRPLLWAARGLVGGGAVYFYFVAIEHLEVGPATLLNYMAPCWAALFAGFFLRERLTANGILGLIVATAGAGIVAWSTSPALPGLSLGIGAWAGIVSAVLSGGAMTVVKALRSDTDAPTVFLSFCLFGALWSIPSALSGGWVVPSGDLFWPSLALGLFSLAAQLLFTWSFKYVSATAGSAATQLTPAFSWVFGVAVLGESSSRTAIVGALICLLGVSWGAGLLASRRGTATQVSRQS
ncbi:MAG: DMT family transporter [Myxococcaceae bacterium]